MSKNQANSTIRSSWLHAHYARRCTKEFIKREEIATKNLHDAQKSSDERKIPLELGKSETGLRFVETHRQDIKTILH